MTAVAAVTAVAACRAQARSGCYEYVLRICTALSRAMLPPSVAQFLCKIQLHPIHQHCSSAEGSLHA
jgi:hypothetical protein